VSQEGKTGADQAPEQRDVVFYVKTFAAPLSAMLTALTVALLGLYGQRTLSTMQREETKRAGQEQRTRLYTELMSRREEAEAGLRKDMFAAILREFFKEANTEELGISKRLLKLELLALNFGESLSLSPMFLDLARDIDAANKGSASEALRYDEYTSRLNSLARRVASWQVAALHAGGKVFRIRVAFSAVDKDNRLEGRTSTYEWPRGEVASYYLDPSSDAVAETLAVHQLGHVTRKYEATFSDADYDAKTVKVLLRITDCGWTGPREPSAAGAPPSTCSQPRDKSGAIIATQLPTDTPFDLDFFDFPMIDNTRLSDDQRFALVLEQFSPDVITVLGIVFPGLYSSQRDKPFLDVVIDQLQEHTLAHAPAE
jgi:hypothetical protein